MTIFLILAPYGAFTFLMLVTSSSRAWKRCPTSQSSGAPREGILSTYDKTGAVVIG